MVVQLRPRAITVERGSRGFGLSLIYRGLDKYEEKDTGIFVARVVPGGKQQFSWNLIVLISMNLLNTNIKHGLILKSKFCRENEINFLLLDNILEINIH
jgi:hypothetical protein